MGITIEDLPAAASAQTDHVIPAMRSGEAVKLTAQQLATFIIAIVTDSAPATLDTLNELAAALGDDPNFATTVANALAGKQPLDAMLTSLAALTSSNGKFLAFSGADAPALRDIVGTVSQSGGVPTGAIIEEGAGPNGRWTKWASGRMECESDSAASLSANQATGNLFRSSAGATWTFPQAFAAAPICTCAIEETTSMWANCFSSTITTVNFRAYSSASVGSAYAIKARAVGRWF